MIHASKRAWRKLPIFDTIGEAYLFVGREFATIIGVSWLPLAITAIATYFADEYVALLGAKILAVALSAIVAVALHRLILFGDRAPRTWFGVPWLNLRFGKVEALFALPPFLLYGTLVTLGSLGVPLEWHVNG